MGYSRYGSSGKGLSDRGTRRYASGLSGSRRKNYVTFINDAGRRIAIGSFQVIGHTAATLGYGGESLVTAPVTHQWRVGAGSGKATYNIYRDGLVFTGGTVSERKSVIDAAIAGKAYRPPQSPGGKPRQSQYGAITTGHGGGIGRGSPSWIIDMINKGRNPDDTGGSKAVPMGLALIALKVLL